MRNVAETNDLIGKQLGDYELKDKLTSGGMAHIYIGIDVKLKRKAAVKILTPEMMGDDDVLKSRFIREAQSVAALEHDNIIAIYQYGEQDDIYFLAMKYVEGKDLAQIPVGRVLRLMGQVASALDFAHANGVIHRDIKPSNVLLDVNDKAILTDFGLALRQQVDQTMGTAFGTPRYISPEQAMASERAVAQSDVYSLAVVTFELLTGEQMFKGSTPMEIALSHISDPPPSLCAINPDIPPAAEEVVFKALAKVPEKRHQTATAFIQALQEAYEAAGVELSAGLDVATKPDITPPPSQDKTPMFDSNEMRAEMASQVNGKDASGTSSGRKRLLLGLAALVLVAVAAIVLLAGNGTPSTASDSTPNNNVGGAQTPVIGPGARVVLYYNDQSFAMYNESESRLDIRDLVFEQGDARFNGSEVTGGQLPTRQCVVILLQRGDVSAPSESSCDGTRIHSQHSRPSTGSLFWRDFGGDTFVVRSGDERVGTCETVARGNTGRCVIGWPAVADG